MIELAKIHLPCIKNFLKISSILATFFSSIFFGDLNKAFLAVKTNFNFSDVINILQQSDTKSIAYQFHDLVSFVNKSYC